MLPGTVPVQWLLRYTSGFLLRGHKTLDAGNQLNSSQMDNWPPRESSRVVSGNIFVFSSTAWGFHPARPRQRLGIILGLRFPSRIAIAPVCMCDPRVSTYSQSTVVPESLRPVANLGRVVNLCASLRRTQPCDPFHPPLLSMISLRASISSPTHDDVSTALTAITRHGPVVTTYRACGARNAKPPLSEATLRIR